MTLNSNLILLILGQNRLFDWMRKNFKFQSDSINTQAPPVRPQNLLYTLNSNLILLIHERVGFLSLRAKSLNSNLILLILRDVSEVAGNNIL